MILAGDLDRTFSGRGNHGEWNPYEVWSSNNARRWVEGFSKLLTIESAPQSSNLQIGSGAGEQNDHGSSFENVSP